VHAVLATISAAEPIAWLSWAPSKVERHEAVRVGEHPLLLPVIEPDPQRIAIIAERVPDGDALGLGARHGEVAACVRALGSDLSTHGLRLRGASE
jgi:hypothetical protein